MIRLITAPAVEPMTITEAKLYLKVDTTADDNLITELIKAVRIDVEKILGYKLINQTWDYFTDDFTDPIILPLQPVSSVTYIKYYDPNKVLTTLAATEYYLFTDTEPAVIEPVTSFPVEGDFPGAVNVRFVAGFGAAATNIPEIELIKRAMYLILGDAYENREDTVVSSRTIASIPNCARNILMPLRSFR